MKKSKPQKTSSGNGSEKKPEQSDGNLGRKDFLVVGIGASAGGVQALREFFTNVPADSGIAYVVILHLSPDYDSQLAEILQTVSKIPVHQVTERTLVEPNQVYVVPPDRHLSMVDGHIEVAPNITLEERRAPVDIFFRGLADTHDSRAICVVLSGTGANGSMGLKRVKERGGIVFVQNPREAEFSEMPRNSIATELVDAVLPIAEIPARIVAYKESLGAVEIPVQPESRPDEQQQALREIFTQLRVRTGHDFSNYKRATVLRRIERRMGVRGLTALPGYAQYVRENSDEAQFLLKDLLISVTNFFRDKEAFAALERDILPRILHGKTSEDQVRVWVAGCATGEEAYSIAMLLAEQTLSKFDAPSVQIFATDLDEAAIQTAREGFYTLNDVADVSPEHLQRFFSKEGEGFRVRREIREMILFANHNLIKDAPFSHLDLVTCRNLLIYFNQAAQERVFETLHFALNPGGFLLVGSSESVDGAGDLFATVSKEHHIYQSRQVAVRTFPVPDSSPASRINLSRKAVITTNQPGNHALERITYNDLHQRLLEQYASPSIVVNEEYDIVHLSERAGRYLQITGGAPSNNLLKLIRQELRLELRGALFQAVQRQTNVESKNLKVKIDDKTETINIHVRPIFAPTDPARGFILVLFEQTHESNDGAESVFTSPDPIASQLEEELLRTKAHLRSVIEQYEIQAEELKSSNEELQAMNEELRSAAEELETGKEELQSINEELVTVNQELKVKIEEISQTRDNFQNLINSTDIATIFLDRSYQVRMFTPPARNLFNLIENDIGRPLSDITHRLEYKDLTQDAETVLEKLQPIEREIRSVDNRFFTMRVLPYRTQEDKINGVVLTFFDVTSRKRAEIAKSFLASIVESSEDSIISIDFDRTITSWNKAAENLYGYTAAEAIGKPLTMLTLPEDFKEVLANIDKIKHSRKVEIFDSIRLNKSGREMNLEVVLSPVKNAAEEVIGVSTIARDVTARRKAEEALRQSEERFRAFVSANSDVIYTMNPNWTEMRSLIGKDFVSDTSYPTTTWLEKYIYQDDQPRVLKAINKAIKTKSVFELEHRVLRVDSTLGWTHSRAIPLLDETGEITEWFGAARDMTERKRAEEALRESHERRQFVLESAKIGEWEMDLTTGQAQRSFIHDQCFGATEPFAEWSYDIFLTYVHPDDRPEVERKFGEAIKGQKEWNFECRVVWADRSVHWIQAKGYFYRNSGENPSRMLGIVSDITEQKQAEEASRESEERLRVIMENLPGGAAFIVDRDLRYLLAEGEALHASGFEPQNLVGKTIFEVLPAELAAYYEPMFRKALAGEEFTHEHDAHGSTYISRGTPLRSSGGEIYAVLAVSYDISERKRAEERMRESEERFRAMFEQANVGMVQVTIHGQIQMPNEGFCKIIGYTEEETRRLSLRDITHPDDYENEINLTRQLINGEIPGFSINKRYIHKNGNIVWGNMTATVVRRTAHDPLYVVGIVEDITERKSAEERLRESEERLRLVVESVTEYAIFTQNNEGIIQSWNSGAENIFGFTAEEAIGQHVDIIFTPEDRKARQSEKEMKTAQKSGRAIDERWHVRKDGSRFFASGVLSPLRNGHVNGYAKIARDLTKQKQIEDELRRSREELEQRVQERTRELADTNESLQVEMVERRAAEEERLELVRQLVTMQEDERRRIARDLHDQLGQQLTVLRLKLDSLRKACDDGKLCEQIDETQAIAARLDAEADFLAWELRPTALDDLGLKTALENFVKEWSTHFAIPAEFHSTGMDKYRLTEDAETNLYRIAQEALNNIWKHSKAKQVSVLLESRDSSAVLIVEDDGVGFEPDAQPKPGANDRGMGLIGMQERAALIGGSLEIESAPGEGTTIFARVPISVAKKRKSK